MRVRLLAALMLSLVLTSCSSDTASAAFELTEFSISGPQSLTSDTVSVGAINTGAFAHTLVVTNQEGLVMAATDLIQPGDSADLEVRLSEGIYSFTCRIVIEDDEGRLVDHFESGMHTTVEVTG